MSAKLVRTPQPGPKVAPVNEKPRTVLPPGDTAKPAAPASPPDAADTVAPSTLN